MLIQMASGSGKTFTAITFAYRLLKFAHAKRILFLVDTKNLGEQAEQEFQRYTPADDPRKFHEIYNVQRLKSQFIDKNSQVCISTIQRMYSILKGEPLDESAEEVSMFEIREHGDPKEVVYNDNVPIKTFDFIIIDECHRSIYNLWKQVLEYFDAFQVGLTATPDKRESPPMLSMAESVLGARSFIILIEACNLFLTLSTIFISDKSLQKLFISYSL